MTVSENDLRLLDLGQAWWRNIAVLRRADFDPHDDNDGWDLEVEMTVDDMRHDLDRLGPLLRALVATVPEGMDLSYLGTGLLEDAYWMFGARVFLILEEFVPDVNLRQGGLVGFRF